MTTLRASEVWAPNNKYLLFHLLLLVHVFFLLDLKKKKKTEKERDNKFHLEKP